MSLTTSIRSARGRHPMLDDVRRMIVDKSCSVLSLDIFDTVLWRRVPRPTDVFGILGARLRAAGQCPSWVSDATFRQMRIAAEQKARERRGSLGTEVSLFDIWGEMPESVFKKALVEELVEAEVDVEAELIAVDLDIADLIQLANKHDIPVILVSDTYFTEDHLRRLLDRPELGSMRDMRVFRSHQHGQAKESGLWEIVLKDLGRSPDQVVHVGDNEIADHETPSELGIRTVHYERIDERFADILDREGERIEPFGPYARHLDPVHGDFGLTSLRAKTLQGGHTRSESTVDTAWRYGASVLGPVLTGFAEWVASKAHAAGTKTLWCPMREGELLAALVNNAAQARGWNVAARPIWLSRHVVSIAALDSFDTKSVKEVIRRSYHPTVRHLLAMLHLRTGDVPSLAGELDRVSDNEAIAERVAVALTESPYLRNRLAVRVTAIRDRLLKVLRTEGALDDPNLTLVDLGWGGTIQFYLAEVLRATNTGVTAAGLYLATDHRSTRVHLAGLRAEGYLAQADHPHNVAATISRSPEVIEQCVNALCGSLIDFADDGSPVLGPAANSPSQNAERKAAQEGVLAFQRQWNRYVEGAAGRWPDLATGGSERLANILISALKAPTPDEAAVFGNWQHEDNLGSSLVTTLLPDDLVAAIPYMSPSDLDDLRQRDSLWPGLIAASDTRLSAATSAIAAGRIDPSIFDPTGETFETSLHFHTDDDKWHEGSKRRVRINHNGLSFARLDFDSGYVDMAALSVPGRPAIVRIDWIEAKVIANGRRIPEPLRWDQPEDFAGLRYLEARWLGANMVEFESSAAAVVLPLAARSGGLVTSAQITVAFAMLPQSRSGFGHRLPSGARITRISRRLHDEYRTRGATGLATGVARAALRRLAGPQ